MSKDLFADFVIDEAEQYALIERWNKASNLIHKVLEDQIKNTLMKEKASNKLHAVIALGLRATRTSQTIRLIADARAIEDIAALTRILIETIITACYLQIAPDSEFKAFRHFFILTEMKHQARFEETFGPMDFMTEEIRIALAAARDKAAIESNRSQKAQSWTDVSVAQRAELVDKHLGVTFFGDTIATAYLKGHAFIHATQESIEHLLAAFAGKSENAEITSEIAIMLHSCVMVLFGYAFFLQSEFVLPPHPGLMEVMAMLGA